MKIKKNKKIKILVDFLFFFIFIFIIYGIYLDFLIKKRINGKIWQLPAIIYGKITILEPDMPYKKEDMIRLLEIVGYYQVSKIQQAGEFVVNNDNIEMIRRSFNFPDSKEKELYVRLSFKDNILKKIKNLNNNRNFGFFRIDPFLITVLHTDNKQQRIFIPRNVFPNILINTLILTEDKYFYYHDGINLFSIIRALIMNISVGKTIQGGSTLTQQLVKNLFLNNHRSLWRKLNEAYMSLIMETRYSKDKILELYLNEVYLGQNGKEQIRGFPLASIYYFGRPINELSLDQYALLVAMVKGASLYNPWRNPELSLKRRNFILTLLFKKNIINKKNYFTLISNKLKIKSKNNLIITHPSFIQMIQNELKNNLKGKSFSGIKVFTTLDIISQYSAEKAMQEGILELREKTKIKDLESAIIIIDRITGEIRSIIGGYDPYFYSYNRVLKSRRLIGSLAKPAIYLTALNHPQKYHLNTFINKNIISIRKKNEKILKKHNQNNKFNEQVTLIDALINSMNIPTINLGMSLGLNKILNTWKELGVTIYNDKKLLSVLLGIVNLTPFEVAQTFQTIANIGNYSQISILRSVISENGKILYNSYPYYRKTNLQQASYLTLCAMQQTVKKGNAQILSQKYNNFNLAAQMGGNDNLVNSWFTGIDEKEVVVIWVGRDNNKYFTSLLDHHDNSGAMKIYLNYLDHKQPYPLNLFVPQKY